MIVRLTANRTRRSIVERLRFKPKTDRFIWLIFIPTLVCLAVGTAFAALEPFALFIMVPTDLFTLYFFISPLFGYVEAREKTLFIKFGFFIKREIPYLKIRGAIKERRIISESMLSLKCALEHVNIKYNTFDVLTVSVKDNDRLIALVMEKASCQPV